MATRILAGEREDALLEFLTMSNYYFWGTYNIGDMRHSEYSILITEYIERCNGFEGFFTKSNVAALTEAAGLDERYEHGHVFD
jgi:hypothetical protein